MTIKEKLIELIYKHDALVARIEGMLEDWQEDVDNITNNGDNKKSLRAETLEDCISDLKFFMEKYR